MLAADALQEMLFQMKDDVIYLFPAIPESWNKESVSFTNFLGEKRLQVSATSKNGTVTNVTLHASLPQTVTLKYNNGQEKIVSLKANETKEVKL